MNSRTSLFKELQRRNVFKVAVAYVIASWLLAQVADLVLHNFGAPDWTMRALLIALAIGFPIALAISWAFEVTPQGVISESDIDRTISITDQSGKRLDRIIILILAIVIIFMGLERFVFSGHARSFTGPDEVEVQAEAGIEEVVQPPTAPIAPASPYSVAVLPFAVMSTGPDDDYFADGLTEEIINALSQLPDLMVTARTSAFYFKDQNLPIGDIAKQLNVANIVEGSVRRAGDQLRITAQLVRADDGFHLWSETYDRRTEDTFAVQEDIATKIAAALNVFMDEGKLNSMRQVGVRNVEAFIAYQKGVDLYERAHMEPDQISLLRQANVQFEEAIGNYPSFADAYVNHSDLFSHVLISNAGGKLDGNITQADVDNAPSALESDYNNSILYAQSDSQRLVAQLDRAVLTGEWRGLADLTRRALLASGCDVALWAQLPAGAFSSARLLREKLSQSIACDPLMVRGYVHLAMTELWLGNPEAVQTLMAQAPNLSHHPWLIQSLAVSYAMQGDFETAENIIEQGLKSAKDRLFASAIVAAIAGDASVTGQFEDDFLAEFGPDDQAALVLEALQGNRNEANRLASMIDQRPFGYMPLIMTVYSCLCGAPFDLEATPVFAEMLSDSGLAWPPAKPINFPLKDW